jgi:hypothetical protein
LDHRASPLSDNLQSQTVRLIENKQKSRGSG